MHNVVVVKNSDYLDLPELFNKEFKINHVKSVKAAIMYQIEFPDIDVIIYDSTTIEHRELISNLEKCLLLNPLILQIINGEISLTAKLENNENIIISSNFKEIGSLIKAHKLNRRHDNRATWPIKVNYHKKNEDIESRWGMILSISVGGCFIKTDYLELGKKGDQFIMNIHFEDFNFLVEGEVVRVQRIANLSSPQGFSIKFHSPSPQTKGFIEEIINNKILSTIFSDFTHLEGSSN